MTKLITLAERLADLDAAHADDLKAAEDDYHEALDAANERRYRATREIAEEAIASAGLTTAPAKDPTPKPEAASKPRKAAAQAAAQAQPVTTAPADTGTEVSLGATVVDGHAIDEDVV
jgi:hypothetical protein